MCAEIEQTLEKISSREKFINGQFAVLVFESGELFHFSTTRQADEFTVCRKEASQSTDKERVWRERLNLLSDELSSVTGALESVKVVRRVFWS